MLQHLPSVINELPRLVGLAAALAVVAVAVTLAPERGREHPFLNDALAAIGQQPVVHVRIDARLPQNDVVDLATGRTQPQRVSIEYWFDEPHFPKTSKDRSAWCM